MSNNNILIYVILYWCIYINLYLYVLSYYSIFIIYDNKNSNLNMGGKEKYLVKYCISKSNCNFFCIALTLNYISN